MATKVTPEQIEIQKKAGKILAEVMVDLMQFTTEGVTPLEIDDLATKLILKKGGFPGFKKVHGYNYATCISVNETVVHGIPGTKKLKKGDVVSIDSGVFLDGFHTDITETVCIGQPSDDVKKMLKVGKKAMFKAISKATVGNRVGDISSQIERDVTSSGYAVIRGLIGHGVGKALHEDPEIPGYLDVPRGKTSQIKPNMVLAIEVIYSSGKNDVYLGEDNWTISTRDGSLTAVFERTILVNPSGPPTILTPLPGDEPYTTSL